MHTDDSIEYDIVLLPEPSLTHRAIDASQSLASFDTQFLLSENGCVPHTSLYMFTLARTDVSNISVVLENIAKKFSPLTLTATHYEYNVGYFDVEYEKTPDIISLQQLVVDGINPLRAGSRVDDIERMKRSEGLAYENLKTYGFRNIGELQRPHITFTRLAEVATATTPKNALVAAMPEPTSFNGTFTHLGLFELGPQGTCTKEIQTWNLS